MKIIRVYIITMLLFANLFNSFGQSIADSIKYKNIIHALNAWDIQSSVAELKNMTQSASPNDEAYFYFFKANITLYTWIQVDSTQENNSLAYIDSAIRYYEKSMLLNLNIQFPSLYIKSPIHGLDTCANIIGQRAKMYFLKEEYLKAMNLYDKILGFSNNPMYFTGAGLTALKVTSFHKAENYFLKAIQYSPEYEKPRIGLCEVYKRLNDSIKGVKTAKEAVLSDSLNKNYLINYYNVSAYFKNRDEMNQAIAKLEPYAITDQNIRSLVANHYILSKEFQKAESHVLSIASKQNENDANATRLKFYYNWFLSLSSNNSLSFEKANSIEFCKNWIGGRMLIRQKVGELLLLKTENTQLQGVVEFLKKELE